MIAAAAVVLGGFLLGGLCALVIRLERRREIRMAIEACRQGIRDLEGRR